jgi:hypothetical protein
MEQAAQLLGPQAAGFLLDFVQFLFHALQDMGWRMQEQTIKSHSLHKKNSSQP